MKLAGGAKVFLRHYAFDKPAGVSVVSSRLSA
jgi:hypothetical protein